MKHHTRSRVASFPCSRTERCVVNLCSVCALVFHTSLLADKYRFLHLLSFVYRAHQKALMGKVVILCCMPCWNIHLLYVYVYMSYCLGFPLPSDETKEKEIMSALLESQLVFVFVLTRYLRTKLWYFLRLSGPTFFLVRFGERRRCLVKYGCFRHWQWFVVLLELMVGRM